MSRFDHSEAARAYAGWYATKLWAFIRDEQLSLFPFCQDCAKRDRPHVPATVVDHVEPHRGDWLLFFQPWPPPRGVGMGLRSLCAPCHDSGKQREERLGYSGEPDEDGWPVDPRHPANLKGAANDRKV